MASPYPICTERNEPEDSENSHAGTFIKRGVWLCIDCALRERAELLDALRAHLTEKLNPNL
jgi:predicted RNA-binding protein YlxR (DUF448 family)|tara:strand:+ start:464 stop:646 length:183 start_codon:yes stop_codon:yes gene_type:complete